jgi:hypothetical protein
MLEISNIICLVVSLLFVWFRTDAFVSYCELFNLFKPTINTFKTTLNLSFPQFLYVSYKDSDKRVVQFVIKLITCPVCLALWLSILICLFTANLYIIPLVFVLSLLTYFILDRVML